MALETHSQAAAAQETEDGTRVGRNSTSKVGFYGATPAVRPVVPETTPDVQDVIDALVTLGLITQSD